MPGVPDFLVPDWPRRWTFLLAGASAALTLTVVGVLAAAHHERAAADEAARAASPSSSLSSSLAAASPATRRESTARAGASPVGSAASSAAFPARGGLEGPARAAGPGEIEVCGIGPLPPRPAAGAAAGAGGPGPAAWRHIDEQALAQLQRLATGAPDARVRASAWRTLLGAEGPAAPVPAAALGALVRAAEGQDDPFAYALAVDACRLAAEDDAPGPGAGGCQLLGGPQWGRLEPRNAAPWLHQAARSAARGDAGGEAEALYRAVGADRLDGPASRLPGRVAAALPADTPPAVRDRVIERAGQAAATIERPAAAIVQRQCGPAALADANHRQTCEALAELLANRSRDAAERELGIVLGQRLGWSPQRLDTLREPLRQLAGIRRSLNPARGAMGCEAMRQRHDWVRLVQARGEVDGAVEWTRRQAPGPAAAGPAGAQASGGAALGQDPLQWLSPAAATVPAPSTRALPIARADMPEAARPRLQLPQR